MNKRLSIWDSNKSEARTVDAQKRFSYDASLEKIQMNLARYRRGYINRRIPIPQAPFKISQVKNVAQSRRKQTKGKQSA